MILHKIIIYFTDIFYSYDTLYTFFQCDPEKNKCSENVLFKSRISASGNQKVSLTAVPHHARVLTPLSSAKKENEKTSAAFSRQLFQVFQRNLKFHFISIQWPFCLMSGYESYSLGYSEQQDYSPLCIRGIFGGSITEGPYNHFKYSWGFL